MRRLKQRYDQGGWRWMLPLFIGAAFLAAVLLLALATDAADAHPPDEGRWVDFGPWNGVIDCEASPTPAYPPVTPRHHPAKRAAEVRADSVSWLGAKGPMQFMPRTWDWVAGAHGRTSLVGVDPRHRPLASQLRQAIRLRDMAGGGTHHWDCGWRYGDGTGPRWVTAEWATPANPERCARNLHRRYGVRRAVALSVCGVER